MKILDKSKGMKKTEAVTILQQISNNDLVNEKLQKIQWTHMIYKK